MSLWHLAGIGNGNPKLGQFAPARKADRPACPGKVFCDSGRAMAIPRGAAEIWPLKRRLQDT
jgi:hypothetical protein